VATESSPPFLPSQTSETATHHAPALPAPLRQPDRPSALILDVRLTVRFAERRARHVFLQIPVQIAIIGRQHVRLLPLHAQVLRSVSVSRSAPWSSASFANTATRPTNKKKPPKPSWNKPSSSATTSPPRPSLRCSGRSLDRRVGRHGFGRPFELPSLGGRTFRSDIKSQQNACTLVPRIRDASPARAGTPSRFQFGKTLAGSLPNLRHAPFRPNACHSERSLRSEESLFSVKSSRTADHHSPNLCHPPFRRKLLKLQRIMPRHHAFRRPC
jgi:hypothetical protein